MINFSNKENIENLINIEKLSLNSTLDIQKTLNKQLLIFMKNFIGTIDISSDFTYDNQVLEYMNKSLLSLADSNSNIKTLKALISKLENLSHNLPEQDFINYNNDYYSTLSTIYNNTSSIEKFIQEISLLDLSELLKDLSPLENKSLSNNTTISSDKLNLEFVENTLVISEIQQKVILPYKIDRINTILLKNKDKYNSLQDVIDKLFTKPISNYKLSAFSRFKEAYKLVIEKENGSKLKATSLAYELFFNYNLHPAIITACNSLNELDIYLACLEDNKLEDFHLFDIKYEIPPSIIIPATE